MTMEIKIDSGSTTYKKFAEVASMEAARDYLSDWAANHKSGGELVAFDIDGDNPNCADAAVIVGLNIRIFTIEPA